MTCGLASSTGSSSPSGLQEHLWALKDASARPLLPCRPAWVRHSESSLHSSFIRSSLWEWEKILVATTYPPLYICSETYRRLASLDPTRVSDGSRGIPQGCLCNSLQCIVVTLWNILYNRNRFHSCLQAAYHPGCSFFISSRKNWDQRVWSATQVEHPILWAYSFALLPKIAKLPW